MTDPAMRDPERNFAYYRENTGYERSDERFEEPRVRWLAGQLGQAGTVLDVGCLPEGRVLTKGYVPIDISEVVPGMMVLDADGEFTEVIETFAREYNGDLVSLRLRASDTRVRFTTEHPVYRVRIQDSQKGGVRKEVRANRLENATPEWAPANDIMRGDFCTVPIPKVVNGGRSMIDLLDEVPCIVIDESRIGVTQSFHGKIGVAPNQKTLPRYISMDFDFGLLVGYYIAEGSSTGGGIDFAFHKDEVNFVADVQRSMGRHFGIEAKLFPGNGNAVRVRASSALLGRLLKEWCGDGAANKRIPEWFFETTPEVQAGVMLGLLRGDGSFLKQYVKFDSVSEILSQQVKFILLGVGARCETVRILPRGFGAANGRILHSVRVWDSASLARLREWLGPDIAVPLTRPNNSCPIIHGRMMLRVRTTTTAPFSGQVYNLKTKSGTYVVEGIAVHNCNDGFVAEICPLAEYAGIELNPVAIANAYPRAKGKIVQDNIVSFDYEKFKGWAGVVVCTEVLEHLPDPEELLRRVRVALKPGGRLVTTSPVGRGEAFEPGNRDHLREWTASEYRALHERAGYAVTYQGMERVYAGRYTHTLVAKVR